WPFAKPMRLVLTCRGSRRNKNFQRWFALRGARLVGPRPLLDLFQSQGLKTQGIGFDASNELHRVCFWYFLRLCNSTNREPRAGQSYCDSTNVLVRDATAVC